MTILKYTPRTFLEIDDLSGARKVVMVGRDGVTYWDALDATEVTPIIIHPSQNPTELGSMMDFIEAHGLQEKTKGLLAQMSESHDHDPLYVMRVLWQWTRMDDVADDDERWAMAQKAAEGQLTLALLMHARAAQYYAHQ